jgi:SagB-type dehydrogenase family enzyme
MNPIDVPDPTPRQRELPYIEFTYPIIAREYLVIPETPLQKTFSEVIKNRQSRRSFGRLAPEKLSSLLWHAAKTQSTYREESGFLWQHKAAPSGGGRHPIDIFIIDQTAEKKQLHLYDPIAHVLCQLEANVAQLNEFANRVNSVVACEEATIIWFVAQTARTLSKYENGESLIWRDSGALLATIYFVAEALDLNCCGLGITGEPQITESIGAKGILRAVGGCLVGVRIDKEGTSVDLGLR